MTTLLRIALSLAALCALPAQAQVTGTTSSPALGSDRLQVAQVLDLRYGDALFLQFTEEDLAALARLETSLDSGLSDVHRAEAELLLAGLYLELGMHAEADRRLRRLLGGDVPPQLRNRAWFYLAKAWYLAGEPARAEDTVRRLAGLLPPELEAQRVHLLANSLTRQGRFAEAADQLDGWQGPTDWAAYVRFNLGVALIRDHQLDVGAHYLRAVARLRGESPELEALVDLAGVTLAQAYLQGGDAALAGPALSGVRLEGPSANRALLLAGWAAAMTDDFEGALTPWFELAGRDPADATVQEALLAIPYAYEKLGSPAQAAAGYERAMETLRAQRSAVDAALVRAREGGLVDELLSAALDDGGRGWAWELPGALPAGDLRLVPGLLASHDFHERLRDQRDLAFLAARLEARAGDLDAYQQLLAERGRSLAEGVARADALLESGRAEALSRRLAEVSGRVDAASANADPLAVAPVDVQQRWDRILRLERALDGAAVGASAPADAARERIRVLKGALLWDAMAARSSNLQERELDVSRAGGLLLETGERVERLRAARATYDASGPGVARIEAARSRLATAVERLSVGQAAVRNALGAMIVAELESRRRRLDAYEVQVRFALAALYDRAATPDSSASPGPAPVEAPGRPGAAP